MMETAEHCQVAARAEKSMKGEATQPDLSYSWGHLAYGPVPTITVPLLGLLHLSFQQCGCRHHVDYDHLSVTLADMISQEHGWVRFILPA